VLAEATLPIKLPPSRAAEPELASGACSSGALADFGAAKMTVRTTTTIRMTERMSIVFLSLDIGLFSGLDGYDICLYTTF